MSDEVATRIVVFIFVAVLMVAIFAWMSIGHWLFSRAAERKNRERNALLRHLAEQPPDSVRLVLEKLRQDDAAEAEGWRKYHEKKAQESAERALPAGVVIMAASVGLSIFLYAVAGDDEKAVWTLGLVPLFVGAAITAFALFGKRRAPCSADDESRSPAG